MYDDDCVARLRTDYQQLQQAAARSVSAAVSESSKLFHTVTKKEEKVGGVSKEVKKFSPERKAAKLPPQPPSSLSLGACVPLVGNGEDIFLALLTEMSKPTEEVNRPILPTAKLATMAKPVGKSVGFGSSRIRFDPKASKRGLPQFGPAGA